MNFSNSALMQPPPKGWWLHITSICQLFGNLLRRKRKVYCLDELPNHLLRDVGLERLIELKPKANFQHRLL